MALQISLNPSLSIIGFLDKFIRLIFVDIKMAAICLHPTSYIRLSDKSSSSSFRPFIYKRQDVISMRASSSRWQSLKMSLEASAVHLKYFIAAYILTPISVYFEKSIALVILTL